MTDATSRLAVVYPCGDVPVSARLRGVLEFALEGIEGEYITGTDELPALQGRRILFVLSLGESGVSLGYTAMLRRIRTSPSLLEGSLGGLIVDSESELYTKSAAQELVLAANMAGCAFVGRPLVEGTASLKNYRILAQTMETDEPGAYRNSARELVRRLLDGPPEVPRKRSILALHASSHGTSNTMAFWDMAKQKLTDCEVTEIGLRNGTVTDCSGCPYTVCLHFGERGGCFYGGVMVQEVYPALLASDTVVMLCPNYNDALSANLTACINRMTALFRQVRFFDKRLYAVVVSGYSGGDILAKQLIAALNMNKTFYLPAHFAVMETANDAGSLVQLPDIGQRAEAFAARILKG